MKPSQIRQLRLLALTMTTLLVFLIVDGFRVPNMSAALLALAASLGAAGFVQLCFRFWESLEGERGLERAQDVLGNLPEGYEVLRNATIGGEMTDAVVVGPTGTWIIETRSWPEAEVDFNGRHLTDRGVVPEGTRELLPRLVERSKRIQWLLYNQAVRDRLARTVVAFTHERTHIADRAKRMDSPHVVRADRLRDLITTSERRLTPKEITVIVELIRKER